jgi:hypothetical protein
MVLMGGVQMTIISNSCTRMACNGPILVGKAHIYMSALG